MTSTFYFYKVVYVTMLWNMFQGISLKFELLQYLKLIKLLNLRQNI